MKLYGRYLDAYARVLLARMGHAAALAALPVPELAPAACAAVALGLRDAQQDRDPKTWDQVQRWLNMSTERQPAATSPPPKAIARRGAAETLMGDLPGPVQPAAAAAGERQQPGVLDLRFTI